MVSILKALIWHKDLAGQMIVIIAARRFSANLCKHPTWGGYLDVKSDAEFEEGADLEDPIAKLNEK